MDLFKVVTQFVWNGKCNGFIERLRGTEG